MKLTELKHTETLQLRRGNEKKRPARPCLALIILALAAANPMAKAADGDLDPTFGNGGSCDD